MSSGGPDSLLNKLEKARAWLLGPLARQAAPAVGSTDVARGHSEQPTGSRLEDLGSATKAMESFCQALKRRDSWAGRSWADGRLRAVLLQLLTTPAMRSGRYLQQHVGEQNDGVDCILVFRLQLLRLCGMLLQLDAVVLDPALAGHGSIRVGGGGGSTSGIRSGGQRAEAAGTMAACVPSRASLQLQALSFGCAVLRMDALPCVSGQLAAACARVLSEQCAEMQGGRRNMTSSSKRKMVSRLQGGQEAGAGPGLQWRGREPAPPLQDEAFAALGLTEGLVALAQAALGVLEGEGPAAGAAPAAGAEAAAHRERRQLCRRLVLLLAASLRDSRMLDHCARAALLTTVGLEGEAGGARGRGDRDGVISLFDSLNRVLAGVSNLCVAQQDHSALAFLACGPALMQAQVGPCVSHYTLATGLRCMCAADGGPKYGLPASYSALPVDWYGGRHSSYGLPAAGPGNILNMVRLLSATDHCAQLLGGPGPPLVLLLRACDLAVRSAAAHTGKVWVRRSGGAPQLQGVLLVDGLLPVALDALLGLGNMLQRSWEQLQCAAPGGEGGGVEVAAAAGARRAGSQLGLGGTAAGLGAWASAARGNSKPADGQALHSVPGTAGDVELLGAAEGADVGSAAGTAIGRMLGTHGRPAAGHGRQEAGAPLPAESAQPHPRPLTQDELYEYWVRWWTRVYATVVYVVPLLDSRLVGSSRPNKPQLRP